MNSVLPSKKRTEKMIVSDLTRENFLNARSAFIGRVGTAIINDLYLVTYSCIFLARNPKYMWPGGAEVFVERFVNVEIRAV